MTEIDTTRLRYQATQAAETAQHLAALLCAADGESALGWSIDACLARIERAEPHEIGAVLRKHIDNLDTADG